MVSIELTWCASSSIQQNCMRKTRLPVCVCLPSYFLKSVAYAVPVVSLTVTMMSRITLSLRTQAHEREIDSRLCSIKSISRSTPHFVQRQNGTVHAARNVAGIELEEREGQQSRNCCVRAPAPAMIHCAAQSTSAAHTVTIV